MADLFNNSLDNAINKKVDEIINERYKELSPKLTKELKEALFQDLKIQFSQGKIYNRSSSVDSSKPVFYEKSFDSFVSNNKVIPGSYNQNGKFVQRTSLGLHTDNPANLKVPASLKKVLSPFIGDKSNLNDTSLYTLGEIYQALKDFKTPDGKSSENANKLMEEIVNFIKEAYLNTSDEKFINRFNKEISEIFNPSSSQNGINFNSLLTKGKKSLFIDFQKAVQGNKQFNQSFWSKETKMGNKDNWGRDSEFSNPGKKQYEESQINQEENSALNKLISQVSNANQQIAEVLNFFKTQEFSDMTKKDPNGAKELFVSVLGDIISEIPNLSIKPEDFWKQLNLTTSKVRGDSGREVYLSDPIYTNSDGNSITREETLSGETPFEKYIDNKQNDLSYQNIIDLINSIGKMDVQQARENILNFLSALDSISKKINLSDKDSGKIIDFVQIIRNLIETIPGEGEEFTKKLNSNLQLKTIKNVLDIEDLTSPLIKDQMINNQSVVDTFVQALENSLIAKYGTTEILKQEDLKNNETFQDAIPEIKAINQLLLKLQGSVGETDETFLKIKQTIADVIPIFDALGVDTKDLQELGNGKSEKSLGSFYNSIANLINFSKNVDLSLEKYRNSVNSITGQNTITEEDQLINWKKENPELAKRYELSQKVSSIFTQNGGLKNLEDSLNAILNINDDFISYLKNFYDNLTFDFVEVREIIDENGNKIKKEIKTPAKEFVKQALLARLDTSGLFENPDKAAGRIHYNKENISGESFKDTPLEDKILSPSQRSQLKYQAGYTGLRYGGNTISERLENAKKELNSLEEQLINVQEEKKKEIKAQILVVKDDIEVLQNAQKPKVYNKKEKEDSEILQSPGIPANMRSFLQKQYLRTNGLQVGSKITSGLGKNVISGTIKSIKDNIAEIEDIDGIIKKIDINTAINNLQNYQAPIAELKEEEQQIEKTTQAYSEHKEKVEQAILAEQEKAMVSKEVAENQQKENKAIQNTNQSYQAHKEIIDGISIDAFTPIFKNQNGEHEYYDESGTRIYSATQLRDALLSRNNPTFKQDSDRIKEELESLNSGESLNFEKLGMDKKSFEFITKVIGTGLKGDLFHELVDSMVKTKGENGKDIYSLEDFQKYNPEQYDKYLQEYQKVVEEFKKLGLKESTLNIKEMLESYMDAVKQSGMTPTQFSEQQLGFKISKNGQNFGVGVTPDQLYSLGDTLGALVDNKTGKVGGYEAFQLTAQKLGLIANYDKFKEQMGNVDPSNLKLYIADVKDGITELIEYSSLGMEEFFNLVKDGYKILTNGESGLTEDQIRNRMNRQLSSGRIIGLSNSRKEQGLTSNSVLNGELYSSSRGESYKISEYLSQYKKVQTIKMQIKKTEEQISSIQQTGSTQEIEAAQQVLKNQKKQLSVLKKGLKELEYQPKSGDYGILGDYVLTEDGGKKLQQKIKEINAEIRTQTSKNHYSQVKQDSKNTKISDGTSGKLMKQYLENYKAQQQLERDIARTENRMSGVSGFKKKNYQDLLKIQQERLNALKQEAPIYDEQNKSINGVVLSTEEIVKFTQAINTLNDSQSQKLAEINTQQKEHKNLIQEIGEGFKASFRNLTDYTLAYKVIGQIQNSVRQLIQSTKDLDSAMVDLQIASGDTRKEIHSMMLDFNGLANEVGKTTQEVAVAANDWLRAGYQGEEAAELTEASMYLSTLGMIESSEATSYLISVLKGWKLEASEVIDVVDKLTVIICGVCLAISIGHKLNCR